MDDILNTIESVKIKQSGYLLNGTAFVPKVEGNSDYAKIQKWIEAGNTPEPEFTAEEIAANQVLQNLRDYKAYLQATDHKFLNGYVPKDSEDLSEIGATRNIYREYIRDHEV